MASRGPAFAFTIEMPGQPAVVRSLQRFAEEISDWTNFWSKYFRDAWYRSVENAYKTQGGSTGPRWAELSAAYKLWKDKHFPGRPVGIRTGALHDSLTSHNAPGSVYDAGPTSLVIGTTVTYGMFMQLGTKSRGRAAKLRPVRGYLHSDKPGGMPPRPPMRVSPEFANLTAKLLQEYAVKTLRGQE